MKGTYAMNKITNSGRFLFEQLTEQIRTQNEAAGIAVAIVDAEGNTAYEQYFGFRDAQQKLPIDQDTIFGLASITKSFAALSIMQLAEAGKVDLEAPVSRYIPEFTNKNQDPVKVWHFLCHSAGFYPVHRTLLKDIAGELGLSEEKDGDLAFHEGLAAAGAQAVARQLDSQTKEKGLIGKPGQYMSYCNDGFGLLSEIVRRNGKEKSFADYVKKHILDPLEMSRSGCDFLRPRLDANAASLYKKRDGRMTVCRDYYDNAFVLGGAGAMKSTVSDMKKYIGMYLNRGKGLNGARILSMEGIRTMCMPRIEYRAGSCYCYGLSVKMLDDLTVVEHGGSLTGVSSNMSWSYGAGAGVIVLCNTSGVPVSVIGDAAMRMYVGRSPLNPRDEYREIRWTKEKRKALCGTYRSGEGDQVEISMEGDSLKTRVSGKEVLMVPVQEYLGIIRNPGNDVPLKLFENEKGEIFAVGFGGRMLPRV